MLRGYCCLSPRQAVTRLIAAVQTDPHCPKGKRKGVYDEIQRASNPYGSNGKLPDWYEDHLVAIVGSIEDHKTSAGKIDVVVDEATYSMAERDYGDVAYEFLAPLQQAHEKKYQERLKELMQGCNTSKKKLLRFDQIIAKKTIHPGVVAMAVRYREELRRNLLEAEILGDAGHAAVEAALQAIPHLLEQVKVGNDIDAMEREIENTLEVTALARRREIDVDPHLSLLLKEVVELHRKMEILEAAEMAALVQKFPKCTSKDKVDILRHEADIYRSLEEGKPAGANAAKFGSVEKEVFSKVSPKMQRMAQIEVEGHKKEANEEVERRLQEKAQLKAEEFLKIISGGKYKDPETEKPEAVVAIHTNLLTWLTACQAEAKKWDQDLGPRARVLAETKAEFVHVENFLSELRAATMSQNKDKLLEVCDSITAHYTAERARDKTKRTPARLLGPNNRGKRMVAQWAITPPVPRRPDEDKLRANGLKKELQAALASNDHDKLHNVIIVFTEEQWSDPEHVYQGTIKHAGEVMTVERLLSLARRQYGVIHEETVKLRRAKSEQAIDLRQSQQAAELDAAVDQFGEDELIAEPGGRGGRTCGGCGAGDDGCSIM